MKYAREECRLGKTSSGVALSDVESSVIKIAGQLLPLLKKVLSSIMCIYIIKAAATVLSVFLALPIVAAFV